MKKLAFVFSVLVVLSLVISPAFAQKVRVGVPPPPRITIEVPPPPQVVVELPPPIVFVEPPEVIVLPETEVYVVPEIQEDIYFYGGWWFRLWNGRWYRSRAYDSGWIFYSGIPTWYVTIHPHWRDNYRNHMWGGHRWDYP